MCSAQGHGSYLRFPADVPSAGRRVVLQLRVRRFACRTAACPRRADIRPAPEARPAGRAAPLDPGGDRPRLGGPGRIPAG
ncbi:hypothetical protein [Streptomyces sp. bgisy126]|uniref:hypothetical protein n=1 Tax=unclassified Streptomyces TaxID=2593676 RepID=UPI003EB8EB9F